MEPSKNAMEPFSIRFRSVFGSLWIRSVRFASFRTAFFRILLPACIRSMVLQNDFQDFASKKCNFGPPSGLKKATFVTVGPSCRPLVPSESHFCRFCRTLEFAKFVGKMCFFCLGPLMHDFVHASHMQFCKSRVTSAIFSSWQWFAHPLFANFDFFL